MPLLKSLKCVCMEFCPTYTEFLDPSLSASLSNAVNWTRNFWHTWCMRSFWGKGLQWRVLLCGVQATGLSTHYHFDWVQASRDTHVSPSSWWNYKDASRRWCIVGFKGWFRVAIHPQINSSIFQMEGHVYLVFGKRDNKLKLNRFYSITLHKAIKHALVDGLHAHYYAIRSDLCRDFQQIQQCSKNQQYSPFYYN